MNWYQRRAFLLKLAMIEPGWGCVRLMGERHIGRVLMFPKAGYRSGFWPKGEETYLMLAAIYGAAQKARTLALPK